MNRYSKSSNSVKMTQRPASPHHASVRHTSPPSTSARSAPKRSTSARISANSTPPHLVSPHHVFPLTAASEWICRHLHIDNSRIDGASARGKLNQEIRDLSVGEKNSVHDYYVRKVSVFLLLSLVAAGVLIAVVITEYREDRRIHDNILSRPGYGEDGTDQSVLLSVGQEDKSKEIDIHIDAQSYTPKQIKKLLDAAEKEYAQLLPGDNPSLDEIRTPLSLPATLQGGAVEVEYYISPYGMIGEDGTVIGKPDEDGTVVTIEATLTCQKKTRSYDCAARVYPPVLPADKQLEINIQDAVQSAQTEDPTDSQVRLPDSVDGKKLHWSYPRSTSLRLIAILMLILPAAYWTREDTKIHDAAKARSSQLELDYSQLLWKLTMLLSAGMTIRGAFTRITAQYEAQLNEAEDEMRPSGRLSKRYAPRRSRRYVYEEMRVMLREMQSGVPEANAYENFGRRCALPSYIKLGSLLSQNLKKGSKGLTSLLEHEAILSMEQHKLAVRKIGERAGVKMLLPMILMFAVVLIVLMVPAFLSM